ncbi:DUF6934 family protein [Dyadobacter soli]|uniref:DUF6934 family protein n=1 Tax=Dyadobacter soli TaxID=659014 RepID=UPI00115F9D3D|nr:hypothetical protein [Dyadobacter soli]
MERYEYDQLDEFTYRFYSVGRNGTFEMRVRFTEMAFNYYNLGFGVLDPGSEWLDDRVELRNGDSQIILATVASIALRFMDVHLGVGLYASGSTPSRTRLYQMGLNRVLPHLTEYSITGLIAKQEGSSILPENKPEQYGEWQEFQTGISYRAFLIFKGK